MALGALRLMKMGIVVKQMKKTVETLGSATVICTDKTGTLTENKMSIAGLYNAQTEALFLTEDFAKNAQKTSEPISYGAYGSKVNPFLLIPLVIHPFSIKKMQQPIAGPNSIWCTNILYRVSPQ